VVCRRRPVLYTDQTHDVENVSVTGTGDSVDAAVVVVWRATGTSTALV